MKKILLHGLENKRKEEIISVLKYFGLENLTENLTPFDLTQKVGYCLNMNGYTKEENEFTKDISNIEFIFLAGLNREAVMSLISYMKEHNIARPIFSMITPTNVDWIMGNLIEDVYEEHLMMTQGGGESRK